MWIISDNSAQAENPVWSSLNFFFAHQRLHPPTAASPATHSQLIQNLLFRYCPSSLLTLLGRYSTTRTNMIVIARLQRFLDSLFSFMWLSIRMKYAVVMSENNACTTQNLLRNLTPAPPSFYRLCPNSVSPLSLQAVYTHHNISEHDSNMHHLAACGEGVKKFHAKFGFRQCSFVFTRKIHRGSGVHKSSACALYRSSGLRHLYRSFF